MQSKSSIKNFDYINSDIVKVWSEVQLNFNIMWNFIRIASGNEKQRKIKHYIQYCGFWSLVEIDVKHLEA